MLDESSAQNPYAPPTGGPSATGGASADAGKRAGRQSLKLLAAAVVGAGAGVAVVVAGAPDRVGGGVMGAAALVALVGFVRGVQSLVGIARAPRGAASLNFGFVIFAAVLANGFMSLVGALLALLATSDFSRGRQLRRFGRVLLPRVVDGRGWAEERQAIDGAAAAVEPGVRAALAAQWRENARTEHASVAAFARLTLDLMALGAPPSLVAAANRDALDEIRHTKLCFSLARALDGRDRGPAAFPQGARARTLPANRTLALAALAVDSLVDGALHEGVSARIIAALGRRCEVSEIRAVLKEIAADEGRHAAHGWDVVRYCLAEGGAAVAGALRGATAALPRAMRSDLPEAAAGGAWERYGIHGHALEAAEYARAHEDLVRRVDRMLEEGQAAA
jgi:hypothetical protein